MENLRKNKLQKLMLKEWQPFGKVSLLLNFKKDRPLLKVLKQP